ncbi:SDR family oxidoreductase [Agrobacterium tumefaciens]|uniref:SDR family oxidoreductase n=1 Tax=Agrobacterium tumefaciens TaxID=358 RepID=UPI0015865DFB|nr:SDR family oxidoreductase [Agrobacterium tumefaciens]
MSEFDLGLKGKVALVINATDGLGLACAEALAAEGAEVWIDGPSKVLTGRVVADLAVKGIQVYHFDGDLESYEGGDAATVHPQFDILVNNFGPLPFENFGRFDEKIVQRFIERTMVAANKVAAVALDSMIAKKWGRIVNIAFELLGPPIQSPDFSHAVHNQLTDMVSEVAGNAISPNVTINNLLPGLIETKHLQQYLDAIATDGRSFQEVSDAVAAATASGRFGKPSELGAFCAFICSQPASQITGQNLLVDGGGAI